jgi:anti-sigma factor ChrR (cupin superfamily)
MALPQDITPVNPDLMDTLVKAKDAPWIESQPGMAWTKILWTGPETGGWAVLLKWNKGFGAGPPKHLSASQTFILKGKLQVRDGVLEAGDYVYEANGMIHDATTALEDTEYLFISTGPVIGFDENGFTGYGSWEEIERTRQAHAVVGSE